mmetsp:Transcript_63797/g.170391  ORF Transcript_63797/g.170391 Transcript_63797/m.170391 type:complete len:259 (-) Transcript_63797:189-965(-)
MQHVQRILGALAAPRPVAAVDVLVIEARESAMDLHPTRVLLALALQRPGLAMDVPVVVREAVVALLRLLVPSALASQTARRGAPERRAVVLAQARLPVPLAARRPVADVWDRHVEAPLPRHGLLRLGLDPVRAGGLRLREGAPLGVRAEAGVDEAPVGVECREALRCTLRARAAAGGPLARAPAVGLEDRRHVVVELRIVGLHLLAGVDAVVDAVTVVGVLLAHRSVHVGIKPVLHGLCKELNRACSGVSALPEPCLL